MKEFCTIIEKGVTIPKIINDYFNPFEPFWGRLNAEKMMFAFFFFHTAAQRRSDIYFVCYKISMVTRPPPNRAGAQHTGGDDSAMADAEATTVSSSGETVLRRPKRGLEWSLRSVSKFDAGSQHFLNIDNFLPPVDSGDADDHESTTAHLEDQSAFEIFKSKPIQNIGADKRNAHDVKASTVWESMNAPLRTGIVDGKKVTFELLSDVTQKPLIPRKERLQRRHITINADRSNQEVRLRFWLMRFSLQRLSLAFFASFILMNLVFAILFYFVTGDQRCCGDPSFTFGNTFAFTIQTSTTIGYGSFSPSGMVSNFLVVVLSYTSTLINTIFAGLLFTKFVTPVINIQFSDVMTLCNVNGIPTLSFRIGNADGPDENPLTDINVRLTYSFRIPYMDYKGTKQVYAQTDELRLLSSRRHGLKEAWTLRHSVDESSPLFGLNFGEHPGNKIYVFTLSVDAVQELSKSTVNVQTEYTLEDILIGHRFQNLETVEEDDQFQNNNQIVQQGLCKIWRNIGKNKNRQNQNEEDPNHNLTNNNSTRPGGGAAAGKSIRRRGSLRTLFIDNGGCGADDDAEEYSSSSRRPKHNHVPPKPLVVISDYSKMSDTEPHQVWYPAMSGTYENETFEKTYQSLSK